MRAGPRSAALATAAHPGPWPPARPRTRGCRAGARAAARALRCRPRWWSTSAADPAHLRRGGRAVHPARRAAQLNLLDLLEGELRFAVSAAPASGPRRSKRPVTLGGRDRQPPRDGGRRRVRVVVEPVDAQPRRCRSDSWLVAFEPERLPSDLRAAPAPPRRRPTRSPGASTSCCASGSPRWRASCAPPGENLQATVEEMETSNEELQATNEELIASNEELQSTNEELHSVNEELYTVNAEYQAKIAELTELTADMNNLLEAPRSTRCSSTASCASASSPPRSAETFNLLPQDVGRRFDTFAHSLQRRQPGRRHPPVLASSGDRVEREVATGSGRHFFLRILPYRGREDAGGVVLTLIDISALKRAQQRAGRSARSATAPCCARSPRSSGPPTPTGASPSPQQEWEAYTGQRLGGAPRATAGWRRSTPRTASGARGATWRRGAGQRPSRRRPACTARPDAALPLVRGARRAAGRRRARRSREWVGHVVDMHERRAAEPELRRKDDQIRAILDNSPAFIWLKDPSGRYLRGRPAVPRRCWGVAVEELHRQDATTTCCRWPRPTAPGPSERQVLETGETAEVRGHLRIVDGEERTFLTVRFPLRDDTGRRSTPWPGISTDITERKRDRRGGQAGGGAARSLPGHAVARAAHAAGRHPQRQQPAGPPAGRAAPAPPGWRSSAARRATWPA